jgi:hypothetical protein
MVNRRNLIKYGLLGTFLPGSPFANSKELFLEQPKLASEFDVIVCGGGPAGIAAAISSARAGVKTCLIELYGCLGGVWTTGLLSNIIDYKNKSGIMEELINRLNKKNSQLQASIYDAEAMKLLLDEMCLESNVKIRLHTRVVGAIKEGKRLTGIVTESNSGREIWKAKRFIDATGNGDLSARAGCEFEVGHPANGKTQPMSLMGIISGIKLEDIDGTFISGYASNPQNKIALREEIEKLGFSPSYGIPTLFAIRPDLMALMANHEYGVSALDAQDLTDATIRGRREVNKIIDGLRSLGGIWENVRLVVTASQIGVREGRRIKGLYQLTMEDIIKGAQFEDAVCDVTYWVDIHSLDHNKDGYTTEGIKAKPYQIPLRSLISKDVDGLMMAGRCISGDFFAHASYRVTGNAVAMGEAAGIVSAISVMNDQLPAEIDKNILKDIQFFNR